MADDRPDHRQSVAIRGLAAFGRFWWEFLIGDTPELFVGVVAVLGVLAVIFLLTSIVGVCPLYLLFGISSKKKSAA